MSILSFDSTEVSSRIIEGINSSSSVSKLLVQNSVGSAIITQFSEVIEELSNYVDYRSRETNFNTAQNLSSLYSFASLLGYKPKSKISTKTTLFLSPDINIWNLSSYTGNEFYSQLSNLQTISGYEDITIRNAIDNSSGLEYLPYGTKTLTFNNDNKYNSLYVFQGSQKTIEMSTSDIESNKLYSNNNKILYIPFTCSNMEEGLGVTADFKYVEVINGDTTTKFRVVNNLITSQKGDYDCEISRDQKSTTSYYLKFSNCDTFSTKPEFMLNTSVNGTSIVIHYIESYGASANNNSVPIKFTVYTTRENGDTLYGVSINGITGGTDEDTIDDIKTKLPVYYLTNYTLSSKSQIISYLKNCTFQYSVDNSNIIANAPYDVYLYNNYDTYDKTRVLNNYITLHLESLAYAKKTDTLKETLQNSIDTFLDPVKPIDCNLIFNFPTYSTKSILVETNGTETQEVRNNVKEKINSLYNEDYVTFDTAINNISVTSNVAYNNTSTDDKITVNDIKVLDCIKLNILDSVARVVKDKILHFLQIPFKFNSNEFILKDKRIDNNIYTPIIVQLVWNWDSTSDDKIILLNDYYTRKTTFTISGMEGTEYKYDNNTNDGDFFTCYLKNNSLWESDKNYLESTADIDFSDSSSYNSTYKLEAKVFNSDTKYLLTKLANHKSEFISYINQAETSPFDFGIYYWGDNAHGGTFDISYDYLYNVLYTNVPTQINSIQLSTLKCDTTDSAQRDTFLNILNQYLSIYIYGEPKEEYTKADNELQFIVGSNLDKCESKIKNYNIIVTG